MGSIPTSGTDKSLNYLILNELRLFNFKAIMSRDTELKERWDSVVTKLSDKFADGDPLDLDSIVYLIGVQELGQFNRKFKKDEKVNLIHIAICRLLEPYGYYKFDYCR